ncbi:cell surface protein, partial [Streptococcus thermophilus]|nr:cell surface protein [Streptococcus thermophilus]
QWYLRATATAMKSSTRTMSGNLIYLNAGNKQVLTNTSVTVSSGKKIAGTTSTNAASGWSSSQGILLDVQPSVQIDSYSGTINWTLQDTP